MKTFSPLLCYLTPQPSQLPQQLSPNTPPKVLLGVLVFLSLRLKLSQALYGDAMGLKHLVKACHIGQTLGEPGCPSVAQLVGCGGRQSFQGPLCWHRVKFPDLLCPWKFQGKDFHTCSSGHFCFIRGSSESMDLRRATSKLSSLVFMTGAGCSWCCCCQ